MNSIYYIFLVLLTFFFTSSSAHNEEQSISATNLFKSLINEAEFKRLSIMMKKSKDEIKKKNDKETRTMNFFKNKFRRNKKAERVKVDGKCLESATTIMRRWKDVAANFEKQAIRFEKKIHASIKKLQKKGAFEPIAKKLIEIGGGNKTGLTCAGSSTSAGAEQLTNITTTLMECENEINATFGFYNLHKELNITTMIHVGFCIWFTGSDFLITDDSKNF